MIISFPNLTVFFKNLTRYGSIYEDLENDEDVKNPKTRDKLQDYILKAVLKLGPSDGTLDFIMAGTILHHDAVLVRMANRPGFIKHVFRAILQWPNRMDLWDQWEEILINDGEIDADNFYQVNKKAMHEGAVLNWPDIHSLERMMKERAGSHAAFESEYQNVETINYRC